MPENEIEIRPQPGPQEDFLASSADIAIIGGAAGGGKTWALLLEPLRHVSNKDFGAVVFRRTYPQITIQGGLWDESSKLYAPIGGVSKIGSLSWEFPRGSRVSFRHLQHESSVDDYYGSQIPLLLFDQLEQFSERQFFYMLARNRSMCGVKPYIRASCNPDPDSWLAGFLDWWIGEDGYARQDRAGVTRWFRRGAGDAIEWSSVPFERGKSVAFYPSSVYDNKILLQNDPGYLLNLQSLALVERERLLHGNWKIKAEAGKVFNRSWFELVEAYPHGGIACRFWDFAATVKKSKGHDPDFTASVLMLKSQSGWFILDCTNERMTTVDKTVVNTAKQDKARLESQGIQYMCRWEIEPGSAAKRESSRLVGLMPGIDVKGIPSQGDKVQRAKALSAQAEAGNVKVVTGPWNEQFLKQLHGFPDGAHDDIVDGASGSFNELTNTGWVWRG